MVMIYMALLLRRDTQCFESKVSHFKTFFASLEQGYTRNSCYNLSSLAAYRSVLVAAFESSTCSKQVNSF